ncbi:MAG TPA: AarF/UbiB family protein [Polyangiaceae bacterium]
MPYDCYPPVVSSVLTAVRDLGRLREISLVLVKHGFGEILGRMGLGALAPKTALIETENVRRKVAWPERVRLVLEDLGPCFMKLGQIASTRADILPNELIVELKKLQDDVPAAAFAAIKNEIEGSLSMPIGELFASFEQRALATATIGQVHRAKLRPVFDGAPAVTNVTVPLTGDTANNGGVPLTSDATNNGAANDVAAELADHDVVVKVQRPGVRATIERDLELLHFLAAILERSIAEARIYDPVGLVEQFDQSISAELDFVNEAQNADRFRQNFEGNPNVVFPRVYKSASSKRVVTSEFLDGKSIYDAVKSGVDGKQLARMALGIVIKMIFDDGFFHADPHPGNIIILGTQTEPVFALIDLGMVGRLSAELRDKTVRLMVAAVRKDSIAVADALYAIGRPTKKVDMTAFRSEVSLLSEKYLGKPLREIQLSQMIRDLVTAAVRYGLEIPTDFMLVGKALMTVEGIGREIDPDLDVFEEAKPYFLELLRRRYGPQQLGNEMLRGLERFAGVAHNLPLYLQEVLDDLRTGRLEIRTAETLAAPAFDRLGRRLFSGMVVASLNVAAGIALTSSWKYRVWASIVLFVSAWMVWAAHVSKDAFKAWWSRGKSRLLGGRR